jgi:hypothetical protein
MKIFLPNCLNYVLMLTLMAAQWSCKPKLTDKDVDQTVRHYYGGLSTLEGGGNYDVSEVTVLEKFKTMHNDTLKLIVAVSGVYENGSIAGAAVEPREFTDTLPFLIYRNDAGYWEGNRMEDFVSPLEE